MNGKMSEAVVIIKLHCETESTMESLIRTLDMMSAPPSGRTDWTREIDVIRGKEEG